MRRRETAANITLDTVRIKATDQQIDALVYELYGLTEEKKE